MAVVMTDDIHYRGVEKSKIHVVGPLQYIIVHIVSYTSFLFIVTCVKDRPFWHEIHSTVRVYKAGFAPVPAAPGVKAPS